ncbi:hypothetical protein Tco_0921157 [Tanacetum coccineum]
MSSGTMHVFYGVLVSLFFMSSLYRNYFDSGRSITYSVDEDAAKIMDFRRLSKELRAVVRKRDGYIAELRVYRSCDDTLGTIEMLSRMQLDDMEKDARLLLMARETQIKVDEKTGFIMRMRNRVVV